MTKKHSTKKALIASLLVLCLCFTMLVGTTFAWFTDSVSSSNNVIKTGNLDVSFFWAEGSADPAAATTVWTDASNGPIFTYDNWEPGYTSAKHLKVANDGTLALNYQMRIVANGVLSKLADVIDVYYIAEDKAVARDDIANATYLGTLTEILGSDKHLSKTVFGALKAGDPAEIHTIIFKMQESAGNEYQNMDLGCTFSVELIATQMSHETDSFDEKYDDVITVPNASVPAALVRPIDELDVTARLGLNGASDSMTLDKGYKFEPTMSATDALSSEYRYWHADFVVKADKDVPASSMALAGYYDAWCSLIGGDWIALTSDQVIPADTEIRLVEVLGATVNWEEICEYGNDGKGFQCGVVDLTGENAGTTLTVELRLFETEEPSEANGNSHNVETGNSIVVGEFTYTFGINNATKLEYALENGGEFTLTEDVELDASNAVTIPAGVETVIDLNGHTITAVSTEAKASAAISNKGTLTLKNGTVTYKGVGDPNFGYGTNTIHNTGKLIIDGATIINTTSVGSSVAIDCAAGAELIINSGVIKSEKNAIRLCPFGAAAINCTINGGTITGARAIQIQLPSNKPTDAPVINLTVNGGTLSGTGDLSLYSYSAGQSFANVSVTITGGTFNNDVCFGGGNAKTTEENVTITGGIFKGYLGRYVTDDGTNGGWVDIAKP